VAILNVLVGRLGVIVPAVLRVHSLEEISQTTQLPADNP